jgi:hypothetical protein
MLTVVSSSFNKNIHGILGGVGAMTPISRRWQLNGAEKCEIGINEIFEPSAD